MLTKLIIAEPSARSSGRRLGAAPELNPRGGRFAADRCGAARTRRPMWIARSPPGARSDPAAPLTSACAAPRWRSCRAR